jgi:hypothetical protein
MGASEDKQDGFLAFGPFWGRGRNNRIAQPQNDHWDYAAERVIKKTILILHLLISIYSNYMSFVCRPTAYKLVVNHVTFDPF